MRDNAEGATEWGVRVSSLLTCRIWCVEFLRGLSRGAGTRAGWHGQDVPTYCQLNRALCLPQNIHNFTVAQSRYNDAIHLHNIHRSGIPPICFINEEWMICTYLQKNVTHSKTTVLLGHTPTTNILHSQCAPIGPAHQSKAQPTFLRLGELHLEDTALQKREEQEHLGNINSEALLTLHTNTTWFSNPIIRTDCSHCNFSSDKIRSICSDQMGQ